MTTQSELESPDPGTLLSGERKVLELIATGAPLETILDALCRVIDEQSGLLSSIFLLDAAGEHLTLTAGPGLPEVWRDAVASFPVTMTACGAAVTRRRQIVSPDIATDPMYAGFYDAANAAGLGAVWSTPFFSNSGRPLGTFAVYNTVPGPPSALHLALVSRATHLASIAVERHLTEQGLRESEIRFSRAFYATPVCMAISSFSDGRFVYVNDAFVRMFGYSRAETIGQTALGLGLWADPGQRPAIIQLLVEGKAHELELKGRTKSGDVLDLILSLELIEVLGAQSVLAIAIDITDRKRAESHLHGLAAKLMQAQDDERRRIAQMLHETTAQDLAALKMLLSRLSRTSDGLSDADRPLLDESIELTDGSINDVRTLAYLLYPPFLDETGLLSALRWCAQGFADRSGIRVDLDLPDTLERLSQDVETTLFRVVQEALINIHRHADSPTAHIRLRVAADRLTLEIEDHGKGIAPDFVARLRGGTGATGVGLAGMRERLQQLGGTLDVDARERGTTVRAQIPLSLETH